MRRAFLGLALALGAAQAAPALDVPFTGTLTILRPDGLERGQEPLSIEGAGTASVVGNALVIPRGVFRATGVAPFGAFGSVVDLSNATGTFSPGGASAPFSPVDGARTDFTCPPQPFVRAPCLLGGGFGGGMALFASAMPSLEAFGGGGTLLRPTTGLTLGPQLASYVFGAPWTTRTAYVTGWTYLYSPYAEPDTPTTRRFTTTGTRSGPLGRGGRLSLVTPVAIGTLDFPRVAGVARLEIEFMPEPGAVLLMGAALLVVAVRAVA